MQADNVSENHRASAFGILTGIGSCAFVCANCCARFLSTTATFQVSFLFIYVDMCIYIAVVNIHFKFLYSIFFYFQVATTVAIFSTVYMRIFLPDSIRDNSLVTSIVSTEKLSYVLLEDYPAHRNQISRTLRSVREMASLMRSRCVYSFITLLVTKVINFHISFRLHSLGFQQKKNHLF